MSYRIIVMGILVLLFFCITSAEAQNNQEYIFGKITTESGEEYTGFMRWGKEEVFWHDIFNSIKKGNKNIESPNKAKKSRWIDFDWDLSSIWEDKYKTTTHSFKCMFGDIRSLELRSGSKVDLVLKNGAHLELDGGSNDIGTRIYMYDYELGRVKLDWNKIDRIDFSQAPSDIRNPFSAPIYGTVHTRRRGTYTGYIKWDLDERLHEDILDGKSSSGNKEIPFENISTIEKLDEGVHITFRSGRVIEISGSNDVDNDNRGIAIYMKDVGEIEIPFKYVTHVDFSSPSGDGIAYNEFKSPEGIYAEVLTFDGHTYSGMIVYDIDEIWELEMIEGEDDYGVYSIPIRNIDKIIPKNRSYSKIILNDGESLLLGGTHDVTSRNDGILIFKDGSKKPIHIEWDDVDEITIK